MTTPPSMNSPEHDEDRDPIAQLHRALVDDLAGTLDLDAGVAEATQAHHYARLTADLHQNLDLDAGLAAIVGVPKPSSATSPTQHPEHDHPPARDTWAHHVGEQLLQLDPPTRLALRTQGRGAKLTDALRRALNVSYNLDLAITSDQERDRTRAIARVVADATDFNGAVVSLADEDPSARARAVARDPDGARAVARALNDALDRALGLNRALNDALDRADIVVRARAVARFVFRDPRLIRGELTDALVDGITADIAAELAAEPDAEPEAGRGDVPDAVTALVMQMREFAKARHAQTLSRALILAMGLALARHYRPAWRRHKHTSAVERRLAEALSHSRDLAISLATPVARELGLAIGDEWPDILTRPAEEIRYLRQVLDRVMDDFIGVDLRSVTLDGVSLAGIRWSAGTRWPVVWEEPIRAASVEIKPGIFQISNRGRRDRHSHGVIT